KFHRAVLVVIWSQFRMRRTSTCSCMICVARRFCRATCTTPKPCEMETYKLTNTTAMITVANITSTSEKARRPAADLTLKFTFIRYWFVSFQQTFSNPLAGFCRRKNRRSEEHTSELQSLRHLV